MDTESLPQRPKSLPFAYILWLFLGLIGVHRFYLGWPKSALIYVVCTVGSLLASTVGHPEWSRLIYVSLAFWVFDLFSMPSLAGRGEAKTDAGKAAPVVLLSAQGRTGLIEAFEKGIVIDRRGLFGVLVQGFKGRKTIPYRSITAVQFKQANAFVNGFIQFSLPGGIERQGLFESAGDENTVFFISKQQAAFERLRDFVEERIGHDRAPVTHPRSTADEIESSSACATADF
jgi:hypothetical protein